jgi:hypothetical protein
MLIADLMGVLGMSYFLKAEIMQLRKILRTKVVHGISRTAYKDKLLAIAATMICFGLTTLWLSFVVLFAEGVIAFIILRLMKKYKGHKK